MLHHPAGRACFGYGWAVLDLVGIDQGPSHPLDELSGKMVAFEVAWEHPFLQHDCRLELI
jgi:hypothetical protein